MDYYRLPMRFRNPETHRRRRVVRWKRLKSDSAWEMDTYLADHIFAGLRTMGDGITYVHYMRDARFSL